MHNTDLAAALLLELPKAALDKLRTFFSLEMKQVANSVDLADVVQTLNFGENYYFCQTRYELQKLISENQVRGIIFYSMPFGGLTEFAFSNAFEEVAGLVGEDVYICYLFNTWDDRFYPEESWYIVVAK